MIVANVQDKQKKTSSIVKNIGISIYFIKIIFKPCSFIKNKITSKKILIYLRNPNLTFVISISRVIAQNSICLSAKILARETGI